MKVCYKSAWWIWMVLFPILSACVKDDDCGDNEGIETVQGIQISFYSRTPCQTATNYPEVIQDLTIGLLNKEGLLITHQEVTGVQLSEDYFRQIEVESGLYTIVAWSGLDQNLYDKYELQDSITTREDLLFRIKRTAGQAVSIENSRIFFGESAAIYVPENREATPLWESVSVNMQEITNRILIRVEGLNMPEAYDILIEAANAAMNLDGSIAPDETIQYTPVDTGEENVVEARFTLLKLETGYNSTVTLKHRGSDLNLFSGSLLGALLLMNPTINLACDHDFTIRFVIDDTCQCGTYAITEIWINNWQVHSYEIPM